MLGLSAIAERFRARVAGFLADPEEDPNRVIGQFEAQGQEGRLLGIRAMMGRQIDELCAEAGIKSFPSDVTAIVVTPPDVGESLTSWRGPELSYILFQRPMADGNTLCLSVDLPVDNARLRTVARKFGAKFIRPPRPRASVEAYTAA